MPPYVNTMKKCSILMLMLVGLVSICPEPVWAASCKVGKERKQNCKEIQYIGSTRVPKASPKVYLKLKKGRLNLTKSELPDFQVSWQAFDRIVKLEAKVGYVITAKSAKEVNMSEELFRQLTEHCEKGNAMISYIYNFH